ncbi:MAG TPA: Crp/Fnr family transcriptional regulator [Jatrophihabitantaceae bacterium]|nr:Crp/Fnr family transcriptional regulator [Jatrophihabitantaceae bacterium]
MPDFVDELAQVPLFAGLDAGALDVIAKRAFVRRLARGQILFSEGEPSDHLFLVRSGRLRVFVASARGDELVLSVIAPGETLGELSVLDRQPRSATVEALDAVELVAVPGDDVRALLESNPAALHAVALALATGMRRLSGTAADLVFLDLPRRLAKLLLAESQRSTDGRLTSQLAMSQTGVAARLGVTRQSLNKAMSALAQRGWIVVEGTTVRIDDADALTKFAES